MIGWTACAMRTWLPSTCYVLGAAAVTCGNIITALRVKEDPRPVDYYAIGLAMEYCQTTCTIGRKRVCKAA